jgi:hypothetical protein
MLLLTEEGGVACLPLARPASCTTSHGRHITVIACVYIWVRFVTKPTRLDSTGLYNDELEGPARVSLDQTRRWDVWFCAVC